jgi:hypothetical protein
MKRRTDPGKNGFLITGLIMMVIGASIQLAWIWVEHVSALDTAEKRIDFYLSLFPSFLQKSSTPSFAAIFLAVFAILFSAFSLRKTRKSLRWLAVVSIVLSLGVIVLALLQLI